MRAFVAIRMNDQVEDAVAKTIDELQASARRRPMGAARQLAYHAQVSRTRQWIRIDLQRLTAGLHQLATRTAPFEVAAAGIGAFPDLEHPRAIWVGLHSVESGALAALAARLGDGRG